MDKEAGSRAKLCMAGIAVISALLFVPLLGHVHLFDWDEINFAESAREMIVSGDWLNVQINYVPFQEKPPLFIWMQAASMKVFGINEFAARFPNAVCGIITLLVLFAVGRRLWDYRFGLTWVMLYGGSILPFLYFKSGIIDPWFNLFIFLGIYTFYRFLRSGGYRNLNLAASAAFIGLGILTKGPVALLVFILTVGIYLLINRFRMKFRIVDFVVFLAVLAFVGGFWFILQIIRGNFGVLADFINYQVRLFSTQGAGHGGFFLYHFVVLLLGVFPASILALPALWSMKSETGPDKDFRTMMLILFWTVLILFTIVRTKIVHYSSLCYFPLTFAAAWQVSGFRKETAGMTRTIRWAVILTGILVAGAVVILTFVDRFKGVLIRRNLIRDPFALDCLKSDAGWQGYEFLPVVVLLAGIMVFAYSRGRNRIRGTYFLVAAVAVFIFLAMYLVTPRIELYSQRPAVDFFTSVSRQDAYLMTLGYKSYAHLFYGQARQHDNPRFRDEEWLLTGNIDKPVYIAAKAYRQGGYRAKYPDLELLYEKNGFAFFKRTPKSVR